MTIYLDLLFLFTFLCNGAILSIVLYVVKIKRPFISIAFGTILATIYVPLTLYFPTSIFNSIAGKLFYSILIVLATLGRSSLAQIVKTLTSFYLISFIVGGFLLSIHYMIDFSSKGRLNSLFLLRPNVEQEAVSLTLLAIGFPLILWVIKRWSDRFILDKFKFRQSYEVSIMLNGYRHEALAFLDSGNELTDPLTNRPVIICDSIFMQRFFSQEDWKKIEKALLVKDHKLLPRHLEKVLHWIPYTTIAGDDYILAIKPDKLDIQSNDFRISSRRVFIGIHLGALAMEGYHCLLHPRLIALESVDFIAR